MKTLSLIILTLVTSLATQAQSLKDRDDSYTFLNNMQKYHEQLLDLAQAGTRNSSGAQVQNFSQNLVQQVQAELNQIRDVRSRLPSQLTPAIDPSKTNAITIANPSLRAEDLAVPGSTMPTLSTAGLRSLMGSGFDKQFAETLTTYQKQGAEMAKKAASEIENPIVKDLARRIGQNLESQEKALSQLAVEISASSATNTDLQ